MADVNTGFKTVTILLKNNANSVTGEPISNGTTGKYFFNATGGTTPFFIMLKDTGDQYTKSSPEYTCIPMDSISAVLGEDQDLVSALMARA